jgi:hypothetical protein
MPDREFKSKEELASLFKEWEQDYALRQREDAHSRPTHPWPSEIAKANKQSAPPAKRKINRHDSGHSM